MAQETREKLGIEKGPIRDIFALLEDLKVLTARFPSEDPNFSGFFVIMGGKPCIYVNTNHPLGRQHYSAAHELCHWQYDVSERNGVPSLLSEANIDEIEYRAECFASAFLIPPDDLISYYERYIKKPGWYVSYEDVIRLQHRYRVSYKAMVIALQNAGLIKYPKRQDLEVLGSKENAKKLEQITLSLGFDTDLINPTGPIASRLFIEDIRDNFKNKRISERKAKSLLDLVGVPYAILEEDGR